MPIGSGSRLLLANLLKIELPDATIRLCDGAFVDFDGERYLSADPVFGTLAGVEVPQERTGDEAPAATLTLLPPTTSAAAVLCDPGHQNSRVRFWMVEVDHDTGLADDASAEMMADMRIDAATLRIGRGSRVLDIDLMGGAERLFQINRGNVLSGRFQKSIWPGELGFDNCKGVPSPVAWGVQGPPRGASSSPGGGARGTSGGYPGAGVGGGGVVDPGVNTGKWMN